VREVRAGRAGAVKGAVRSEDLGKSFVAHAHDFAVDVHEGTLVDRAGQAGGIQGGGEGGEEGGEEEEEEGDVHGVGR